jgi:hypothetical protein
MAHEVRLSAAALHEPDEHWIVCGVVVEEMAAVGRGRRGAPTPAAGTKGGWLALGILQNVRKAPLKVHEPLARNAAAVRASVLNAPGRRRRWAGGRAAGLEQGRRRAEVPLKVRRTGAIDGNCKIWKNVYRNQRHFSEERSRSGL